MSNPENRIVGRELTGVVAKALEATVRDSAEPLARDATRAASHAGVHNPTRVGSGTTADAVRHELATGARTAGRGHITKTREMVRGLTNWMRRNPGASAADRSTAQHMLDDLTDALGGN